jgi:hypothetical protein
VGYGLEVAVPQTAGCFLCPGNELLAFQPQAVVTGDNGGYAIPASVMDVGTRRLTIVEHHFLLLPFIHSILLSDLPSDWMETTAVDLAGQILATLYPELSWEHVNISINFGKPSGRQLEHFHAWLIIRVGEEGTSVENIGMSAIMRLCRELEAANEDLMAHASRATARTPAPAGTPSTT